MVELVSLRWERIQVIVRFRPSAPGSPAPSAVRLQRADDPAIAMAATRAWSDEGEVVARFNVMQGPRGVPLVPGTWLLSAVGDDGTPAPLPVTRSDGDLAAASFATRRGAYMVQPWLVDGQLRVEVRLTPGRGGARRSRTLARLGRLRRLRARRAMRALQLHLLRLGYRASRLIRGRDPRRILFVGHYGTELSGDMQAVLARMAETGVDRERTVVTLPPLRMRSMRDRIRAPWELARAGTIVIEEDVLFMIPTAGARVIQLWHASGALKTIGLSRIGQPHARSPWGRHYRYFTYAIVSGEHDVPLFAEAFGMPEERVLPLGHPRMDRFFDVAWRARAREAALEAFPMAKGRRVILFAPTWRASGWTRVYDLSVLDYSRLHAFCVETDSVFIVRLHPTVSHPVEIPPEYRDRIVDGTTTVMDAPEVLCATDLLITDYSSIILEFALLNRPMLFFAPDLEAYRAERDVYMPYEAFVPGRIVQSFEELLAAMRTNDYQVEKVKPFADSQFTYQDGRATDRVIDLILDR
jgi:CDP-ribitol ribitolphosphotransferase / teichoic acid ribitol-phosphate polymerase